MYVRIYLMLGDIILLSKPKVVVSQANPKEIRQSNEPLKIQEMRVADVKHGKIWASNLLLVSLLIG